MPAHHVRQRRQPRGHPASVRPHSPREQTKAQTRRGQRQRNPPNDLIIRKSDGTPAQVSWTAPNGRLMHRAFDGAFPARYPQADAIEQCQEAFAQLIDDPDRHARRRALTMLTMAEDGLHTSGYDAGRTVNRILA